MAGATTTASAARPRCVCGMGSGLSHRLVRAGSALRAENVRGATKRWAPSDRTGLTAAPASDRRRSTSTALYAAIPPHTPSTMRRPARTVSLIGASPSEWGLGCRPYTPS